MANQLILLKKDFFTDEQQAVTVADRYPQDVFAEHTHEFCELVMVWRGNGLHVLNERPYRITRGDLFYIPAEKIPHITASRSPFFRLNSSALMPILRSFNCPARVTIPTPISATKTPSSVMRPPSV